MTCDACGAELPGRARFCLECGAPVAGRAGREARKTVTLLFTDVTGSTALGERLDPEAYRGVMTQYFEAARAAVELHGGTVEKFVGDAVLAVFGVPEVREDDALRAVRAARDLKRAMQALSDELVTTMGIRIAVRTGVNTGPVVTGSARAGGSFATGDAVNAAARLEQAAPPGEVLIGAETFAMVRDAVDVAPVEPVVAKGKSEPLKAYRLIEVHEGRPGRLRRQDAALVGRERETRVLVSALEQTLTSHRGRMVTVVGAPGIGKSRLVSEFLTEVGDRAEVISGRCVSYGQGITYWPVVQLLRQALGLNGGESDEVTRHSLDRLLGRSPDGAQVRELLLPLLGKGGEPGDSEQTFWAVRRAVEELAVRRPLVVTVDDLHWAEPTLLELIGRLHEEVRELPVLLVCQARPELLDDRPGWGGDSPNSVTFALQPFSEDQTAASLTALLGGRITEELGASVAEWAGGNPLFVEEVVTHLLERGLLSRTDSGWALTGDLREARVPPTIAALLAARLDRLPDLERRLLERISIVGLELTTTDAVVLADETMAGSDITATLYALVRRDLLHHEDAADGPRWAFRHILVRDAAYESLPKSFRAELHERYADHLESAGDAAGPERPAFVAHHLEQALRYRRELTPHDPALDGFTDRTVSGIAEAAAVARDREDLSAAEGLLLRGLALDPPAAGLRRSLLLSLVEVYSDQERVSDMAAAVEQFAKAMDGSATELDRAGLETLRGRIDIATSAPVDPDDVARTASRCADLARAAGDDRLLVIALRAITNRDMMAARWEQVRETMAEILSVGRAHDRRWARLFEGAMLTYGPAPFSALLDRVAEHRSRGLHTPGEEDWLRLTELLGRAAANEPGIEDALMEAQAGQDAALLPVYRNVMLGLAHQLCGDVAGAIRRFEETSRLDLAAGDLNHASTVLAWAALLKLERDNPLDEVEVLLVRAAEVTSPFDVISLAMVEAARGILAARRQDHDAARAHLVEAIRLCDTSDQVWQQADFRRWASMAAGLRGDHAEERRLLGEALELYRAKEIAHWVRVVEERLAELQ